METQIHQHNGSGNWIAFLFGVVFNTLSTFELSAIIDYSLQAIIGGIICLLFKILADILSPIVRFALKQLWAKVVGIFEWLKDHHNDDRC